MNHPFGRIMTPIGKFNTNLTKFLYFPTLLHIT